MKDDQSHTPESSSSLRNINLFEGLDEEDCAHIWKLIKWKNYKKGAEVIAYKGEDDEVYFIASGSVRVTIFSLSGKEISYQDLGPGEMFGELSAIDQLPRTTNVFTTESSRIGVVSRNDYWKIIEQYPAVTAAAMKRLVSLVRFLVDRVYQYGAMDVKDRIRIEILRLARENLTGDDAASIPNFPTHREIASRVNTHREAVTRELNELSRMGVIAQHQRVMTVAAVSRLSELLADDI